MQLFKTSGGSADSNQSAANAVGVLSKADQLGDGTRDPWGVALELASNYAGKFRDEVATVVPVIGLVAETAETAALTETDAKHLATLAAMEEKAFNRLLWSTDRFTSAEAPVEPAMRERLLVMLDLYGVQRAVTAVRGGAKGAVSIRRQLSALSGIAEVKQTLAKYFREQDHVLKVRSVLDSLRRLSLRAGRDRLDRARALSGRGRGASAGPGHAPCGRARDAPRLLHRPRPSPRGVPLGDHPALRARHGRQ